MARNSIFINHEGDEARTNWIFLPLQNDIFSPHFDAGAHNIKSEAPLCVDKKSVKCVHKQIFNAKKIIISKRSSARREKNRDKLKYFWRENIRNGENRLLSSLIYQIFFRIFWHALVRVHKCENKVHNHQELIVEKRLLDKN